MVCISWTYELIAWDQSLLVAIQMTVILMTHSASSTMVHIGATKWVIGIDTNIEVIVVSLTTWEAHHNPRAKRAVVSFPIINKYCQGKCSIWSQNCPGYSMVTCAHLGIMWPDCFSLVTRVATAVMSQWGLLNKIPAIYFTKTVGEIFMIIIILGKQITINQNIFIR